MIIDASADALYRSAGSGAWRGRAFWLCLVHCFVNSCTDPQTSEWYSYFKNDVLIFIERQGLRNVKPCFFIQGHGREIFRGHLKFNGLEAFLG